jgi:hypothetical protein
MIMRIASFGLCGPSGSELVPLDSDRGFGSGTPNDRARQDQLELNAPIEQDRPVDGDAELPSSLQRPWGGKAESRTAYVDHVA